MRTTDQDVRTAGFDAYVALISNLAPETLPELRRVTADNVRFCDPFNDVEGRGAMLSVLERTFDDVRGLDFVVLGRAMTPDGDVGYLRWRMTGRLRALFDRPWSQDGMSEVHLDTQGLVTAHIDYWDAASGLYEHIPVLGTVLRIIRRRVAAF